MRPAEVGPALVKAAGELVQEIRQAAQPHEQRRGATLAELASKACVGQQAARNMVPKLKRRGHLQIVGERRVDYRNRPVAEYAPPETEMISGPVWVNLGHCLSAWAR